MQEISITTDKNGNAIAATFDENVVMIEILLMTECAGDDYVGIFNGNKLGRAGFLDLSNINILNAEVNPINLAFFKPQNLLKL